MAHGVCLLLFRFELFEFVVESAAADAEDLAGFCLVSLNLFEHIFDVSTFRFAEAYQLRLLRERCPACGQAEIAWSDFFATAEDDRAFDSVL